MLSTTAHRLLQATLSIALGGAGCVGSERSGTLDDRGATSSATLTAEPASSRGDRAAPPAEPTMSGPPVRLRVTGPRKAPTAGSTIDLDVLIDRRAPSTVPMVLTADLPPGAWLLEGRAVEAIVDRSSPVARRLQVRLDVVPERDLVVRLDVQGVGFGAHAEAAYRFGRPEPKLMEPPRVARPIELHGYSLGQPVRLDPDLPAGATK